MTGNRDVQSQVSRLSDGRIDSIGLFDYCTPRIKATPPWYAYVKIAEGCNNRCSYCLVPVIRGKLRTRKREDILSEVRLLAKRGVKEIIYVAQDTAAYPRFDRLLKETAKIPALRWIRVMYAHPEHMNDNIIKAIATEQKVVKYLDLPIQHASDGILKAMNRHYRRADLEKLIAKIRERIPDIVLRTSIIVGFPGEGKSEFHELLAFIKKAKFEKLGAFTYSREKGTAAGKMKSQVPERIKKARFDRLMRLQARISRERNCSLRESTLLAVIEGKGKRWYLGRTYRDAPEIDGRVLIKKTRPLTIGEFVKTRITGSKTYDLIGTAV